MGIDQKQFLASSSPTNRKETIAWWESRRVTYNLIVGIVGIVSTVIMELFGSTFIGPGEDFVEPLGLILGALLFGLAANAGYTLGWIIELRIPDKNTDAHRGFRARNFKKVLFWFSILATLPVWLSVVAWVVHLLGG